MVEARAGAASAAANRIRMTRALPALAAVTRPDLGIVAEDGFLKKGAPVVIVHRMSSAAAPGDTLFLEGPSGRAVTSTKIAARAAPTDLTPRTVQERLTVPAGAAIETLYRVSGDGRETARSR